MNQASAGGAWMLRQIAELALSDPLRAGGDCPARPLSGWRLPCAWHAISWRWRGGVSRWDFDLHAFSCVVDDAARQVRLSRRIVKALREGASLANSPNPHRLRSQQSLARFRPYLAGVAARYTGLRPVEARFIGRCPFHEDVRPSSACYPDGQFFCFGCLEWDDAVDLVSLVEELSIPHAVARLAQEFGDGHGAPPILRQGQEHSLPRLVGAQGKMADPLRR